VLRKRENTKKKEGSGANQRRKGLDRGTFLLESISKEKKAVAKKEGICKRISGEKNIILKTKRQLKDPR